MTFLGEKVLAKNREAQKVHEEVRKVVNYLNGYANRKLREDIINDYVGEYCKFGIRIIGRSSVINRDGEKVYINHLKKIAASNETLYLIGNNDHKKFMKGVFKKCKNDINYSKLSSETYVATIKDSEGKSFTVMNYMMILRNNSIKVYHKK